MFVRLRLLNSATRNEFDVYAPDVRDEAAQSRLGVAQQVHWPAVSSQGEFHVMGRQLEGFELVGFVQRKELRPAGDWHSGKEFVDVVLILQWSEYTVRYAR